MSIGGGGGRGGGIANSGTLILENSVVSGNIAHGGKKTTRSDSSFASGVGGGIWSIGGKVTISGSTISNNIASGGEASSSGGYGGGIANFAELLINKSTVSGNSASGSGSDSGGHGGGIYNSGGILTITNSTIAKNTTSGGSVDDGRAGTSPFPNSGVNSGVDSGGGGIVNSFRPRLGSSNGYSSGILTLTNSTIWGNASASSGGGIINWGSQADITFCTILANSAASGGGIAVLNGDIADKNNQAPPDHVQVRNSIVAGNHAPGSSDVEGAIVSDGYNLFQTMPGAPFTLNQIRSTDVLVAPGASLGIDPALSGEAPQVLALLPKSLALERIPLEDCHPGGISTDERGIKRPQGSACDIGAYEYVPPK
jgi:hypothetical protein